MNPLRKLSNRLKQRGLRATFRLLWKRYVFFHWELLWMERDLVTPIAPNKLRPYPPLRQETVTAVNVDAFAKYFGDRVKTMRELAADGHVGHMYLNEENDAVAFIWASTRDYYDRHYYRCWFPIEHGDFFEFGAELIRRYWGTRLSTDLQVNLWTALHERGYKRVVDCCETHNTPALSMHVRLGYREQGRITHIYGLFGLWHISRETRYSGSRLSALRKSASTPVGLTTN